MLIRLYGGDDLSLERLRGLLRLYRTLSAGAAEVLVGQWILHDQGAPRTEKPALDHAPHYQESVRRKTGTTGKPVLRVPKTVKATGN